MELTIPENESEIPEALAKADQTLKNLRAQESAVLAQIKLIQDMCSHPEKIEVCHTGITFMRCTTCGREW